MEYEVFFTRPKGRTLFEYISEGSYVPHKGGFLLYFDGRVYKMDQNLMEPGPATYRLVKTSKDLADSVKKLLKLEWNSIQAFPCKVEDVCGCDGCTDYYKFLSKRSRGYMMDESQDGAEVVKMGKRVSVLFRKYGCPMEELDLDTFVEKWLGVIQEIREDRTYCKLYEFIDSEEFPLECRDLGFEMDCGESYVRKFGAEAWRKLVNEPTPEQFEAIDDLKLLGNVIFSQWRNYNHWCDNVRECFKPEFFEMGFGRMGEMALNGNDP